MEGLTSCAIISLFSLFLKHILINVGNNTFFNLRKNKVDITQWAKSPKKQSVKVYFWQYGTVF